MKKTDKNKELLLEQLKKTPIIQIACEKSGVSRMTFYRWKKEDKEFSRLADEAMLDGQLLVNDLAESQLVGAVKDRNLSAIMYWLKHHHRDYAATLEIKHALQDENLTPEQEAIVREALRLASMSGSKEIINKETNERQEHNSTGASGGDDQGQESPSGDH